MVKIVQLVAHTWYKNDSEEDCLKNAAIKIVLPIKRNQRVNQNQKSRPIIKIKTIKVIQIDKHHKKLSKIYLSNDRG